MTTGAERELASLCVLAEARAERYRLAWTSARQRAMNHLTALVEADDERDALRQALSEWVDADTDQRVEILRSQRNACLEANTDLHGEIDMLRGNEDRLRDTMVQLSRQRDEAIAEAQRLVDAATAFRAERDEARAEADRLAELGTLLANQRDEARAEVVRQGRELEAWKLAFGADALTEATTRLTDAPSRRPWTYDEEITEEGRTFTRVKVKRACNGCGELLGDCTDEEFVAGMTGRPLPDVRGECLTCTPARP